MKGEEKLSGIVGIASFLLYPVAVISEIGEIWRWIRANISGCYAWLFVRLRCSACFFSVDSQGLVRNHSSRLRRG